MVDQHRAKFGAAWVNACIADGIAGKPNRFYAFENGHIVGTPFDGDAELDRIARTTAMLSKSAYMVMGDTTDPPVLPTYNHEATHVAV